VNDPENHVVMPQNVDVHRAHRLKLAIGLTVMTLLAEVAGGLWDNSMALPSDAAKITSYKRAERGGANDPPTGVGS